MLAAVALLGERMGVRRWLATAVGFLGVLVIRRPGFQTLSLGGRDGLLRLAGPNSGETDDSGRFVIVPG